MLSICELWIDWFWPEAVLTRVCVCVCVSDNLSHRLSVCLSDVK